MELRYDIRALRPDTLFVAGTCCTPLACFLQAGKVAASSGEVLDGNFGR